MRQLALLEDSKGTHLKRKVQGGRPIGIDLFAGAGGLTLGFEQAGFDVVAAVEIDPIHAATHEFNFPHCATICRSVIGLTATEIRKRADIGAARVDVVFGGAPCQGFSMIGKRALDDPRNKLVHEFVRLVIELDATYFVFENVKGLTLGKHRRFLDELIAAFKTGGYDVVEEYKVLNAADFGVPQNRERLFLLGAKRGFALPSYPEKCERNSVRDAIEDLPDADRFPELEGGDSVRVRFHTSSKYARKLRGMENDSRDLSFRRAFDQDMLTSSMRTEHTALSRRRFRKTRGGETEPISRFLKLDWDGLCNTLRAGTDSARGAFTSPRPIHPASPRVITVREAARIHSYPDWFRFHVTKWHGFRQIGNSVPPLLARAVAERVREAGRFPVQKPNTEPLPLGPIQLLMFDMSAATRYFDLERTPIANRVREFETNPKAVNERIVAYG